MISDPEYKLRILAIRRKSYEKNRAVRLPTHKKWLAGRTPEQIERVNEYQRRYYRLRHPKKDKAAKTATLTRREKSLKALDEVMQNVKRLAYIQENYHRGYVGYTRRCHALLSYLRWRKFFARKKSDTHYWERNYERLIDNPNLEKYYRKTFVSLSKKIAPELELIARLRANEPDPLHILMEKEDRCGLYNEKIFPSDGHSLHEYYQRIYSND